MNNQNIYFQMKTNKYIKKNDMINDKNLMTGGGKKYTDIEIENFLSNIDWEKPENLKINFDGTDIVLIPTIIVNFDGNILGLVYSSRQSITMSIKNKRGVFFSRKRGLWIKSPSEISKPTLLSISLDCDNDAIIFRVDQKNEFCHREGHKSCFQNTPSLSFIDNKITLGICKGHQEKRIYELLQRAKINIFKPSSSRDEKLRVETMMHNNIDAILVKPNSILKLLENDIINVAICYEDNIQNNSQDNKFVKIKKSTKIHPVSIVAVKKINKILPQNPKICSEYKKTIVEEWMQKTTMFPEHKKEELLNSIVYISNTEALIGNYYDIGITMVDSGDSLRANDLEIIDYVWKNIDIAIYFKPDILKKEPRFFRDLKNYMNDDIIYFYSVDDPIGGFMSNFYPSKFIDNKGREWKTSEHYYQAHKFINHPEIFEKIRNIPTARDCYREAWKEELKPIYLNPSSKTPNEWWQKYKDIVMKDALIYKFSQNPELKKKLLDTGNKILIEHAMRDYHYGSGVDDSGKNVLGVMLMELRDNFQNESGKPTSKLG